VRIARRLIPFAFLIAPVVARAQAPAPSVKDLPLTDVPVTAPGRTFAVFFTGDGNFAALDQGVSAELTARGIPVVAFNQRSFLWSRKTPEQAGEALGRIIELYAAKWKRDSVVVIGYSRGAGIAPYAVNRLRESTRARVSWLALIGASHTAGFTFHLRDMLRETPAADEIAVMPEMKKLGALSVVCFYGSTEDDTICPELPAPAVAVRTVGGHYYLDQYAPIGRKIAMLVLGEAKK
jgi:type IV secretory pathway VirJ component